MWTVAFLWAQSAHAAQVLDLGKLQVQAKQRGPDIQIVDPLKLSGESAKNIADARLKEIEKELLLPAPRTEVPAGVEEEEAP